MRESANIEDIPLRSKKYRMITGFTFGLLIILSSLSTGGCLKRTVGKWDSDSVTDLEIINWTRRNNALEVNITMTNNNYTMLPIASSHFNVYDKDDNLHGCTWTNYSELGRIVEIKYNQSYYITLRFDGYYADNNTDTPDMLEYDYPNHHKQVSFEISHKEELDSWVMVVFIAAIIVICTVFLILIMRRKRNTFME